MSAVLRLSIDNENELVLGLSRSIRGFEDQAKKVMRAAGDATREITSQLAPKGETGLLSRSVKARHFEDGIGFEVGWFWQDFANANKRPYYWWVEYGSSLMEPQPSLGPAWDSVRTGLYDEIEALFARAVR